MYVSKEYTVEAIAKTIGVSRKTVYRHLTTKSPAARARQQPESNLGDTAHRSGGLGMFASPVLRMEAHPVPTEVNVSLLPCVGVVHSTTLCQPIAIR